MATATIEPTAAELKYYFKRAKYYGECAPHAKGAPCGRYAMPFEGLTGMRAHDTDELLQKWLRAKRAEEGQS